MLYLKTLVHLLALTPLSLLMIGVVKGELGADPQDVILHTTGLWALRFLLVTLAVTPVRILTGFSKVVLFRRMLGLYSAFYLLLHLLTFCWFFIGWDWRLLIDETIQRPYILVGFVSFIIILLLAITSTRWMQKKLGKHWKSLHRLIYIAALLALVHFIWQSKADLNVPLIYGLILLSLLSIRFVVYRLKKAKNSSNNIRSCA